MPCRWSAMSSSPGSRAHRCGRTAATPVRPPYPLEPLNVFKLNDKKAVVTGGGSGIGKAIARLFAQQGAFVHVIDLNDAACADVVREIREEGGQVAAHAV